MLTSLITLADGLDSLGQHEASNALDSLLKYAANRSDSQPRFKDYATLERRRSNLLDQIDLMRHGLYGATTEPGEESASEKVDRLTAEYKRLGRRNQEVSDRLSDSGEPEPIPRGMFEDLFTGVSQSEVDHFNDEIRAEEIDDEEMEDDASDNRSDSMPLYKEYAELMRKSDRIKQKMDELSVNSEEFDELDTMRQAIHDRIDAIAEGIQSETYPYRMTGQRAQDFVNERLIPDEFRLPE